MEVYYGLLGFIELSIHGVWGFRTSGLGFWGGLLGFRIRGFLVCSTLWESQGFRVLEAFIRHSVRWFRGFRGLGM